MIYIGENEVKNIYIGSDETNVYIGDVKYNEGGNKPQVSVPQWVRGTPYNTDYAEAAGRDLQVSDDGTYRIGYQYFYRPKNGAWGTSHCAGMKSTVSNVLSGNNGKIYLHVKSTNSNAGWGVYVYVDGTSIQSWANAGTKEMTININDDLEHTIYVYGTRLSNPAQTTSLDITAKLQYNY